MTDTTAQTQSRPSYIQGYDEALLQRIFGANDGGQFSGGLIDDPELFNTLNYTQAEGTGGGIQDAVVNSFGTDEARQNFMDRYLPYYMDADGNAKYLPEAGTNLDAGSDTVSGALTDYFPDAQGYLDQGVGGVDVKSFYDNELSDARNAVQGGLGQFDPSSVENFMNPYQEQVVDAALSKIDRQGAQRRQADAANAINQNAFGGSRSGVQAAETERAIAEARQSTVAGLMSKGYDNAMSGAQAAYENAAKRGIAGGQQLGSIGATSAGAQSTAEEAAKKRYLETGRLTGGLGSTVAQIGGTQADIGKGYAAVAGNASTIGSNYAGMAPSDMGFMYELGGKDRQYDQQYNDFQRANEALKTQDALAPYSYGQNFLTGSPSSSMYGQFTQAPSSAPNPFLQGVGAYATYQGMQ